ncbi:RNA-directed DNA polymerase, eukaryota, reverse transcriptase zinc-binding domain protein [Tanacetum coccineum]
MTKRCAQYEKDVVKQEARSISLELKSQNESLTSVQNGHVLNKRSDKAKIKFDNEDLETINIEIGIWNVRGMSTFEKQNEVEKFITDENLQVCATLETHLKSKKLSEAHDKAFGKWNWISNVHLCISFVSFVYAANGSIKRRNLWADLNRYKQITTGKPWIIRGDMNVILNTNEHSAGVSFVSSEMQEFKDCVNLIEVEDLCSSGLFFTWTKNLKKAREGDETGVLKNLDRVMVNEDFLKKYDQAHVIFNPYLVSDHSQSVIIIPNSMKRKKKAFRFANFVADKEYFIPIVEKGWKIKVDGFQMFQLVKKIRSLKIHLRKLNWHNSNLFEKVEEFRDELMNI